MPPKRELSVYEYEYGLGAPPSPPSARTRRLVQEREQGSCWLCGLIGVCIVPIIAATDAVLFDAYRRQGVITMSNSHRTANNLMLLCGGCSSGFDQRPAIWVFLPSDLDALIEDELEFQATRRKCAKQGWVVDRTYDFGAKILYTRYLVRSGYIRETPFLETPQKTWSGDPVAAIIRSQSVISGMQPLPVAAGGIPTAVTEKLTQLLMMYSDVPPALVEVGEESDGEESDGEEPDGEEPDGEQSVSASAVREGEHDDKYDGEEGVFQMDVLGEEYASEDELEYVQARCRVLGSLLHDSSDDLPKTWAGWKARLAELQYRWHG